MKIRPETQADIAEVREINLDAFPDDEEAGLVDALREAGAAQFSLVADKDGSLLGHILFSPVTIDGADEQNLLGLAPMAVRQSHQNQGIGTLLVNAGLEACGEQGVAGIVVLGHPEYYPRFGFSPASKFGLRCEYDVPDEVFMAVELQPGAFGEGGLVRYHDVFGG